MPTKKNPETQAEQSKRFKAEVRKRAKAGDFDPAEADAALDNLVASQENKGRGDSKR